MRCLRVLLAAAAALWLLLLPRFPALAAITTTTARPVPNVTLLANGARLVTLYQPGSPLVSIDVFFRVGVDDEAVSSGITGLVTRAWFADARWRTVSQLRRDLGTAGAGAGSLFGGDFAEIWSVCGASDGEVRQAAQTLLLNLVASPGFVADSVATAKEAQTRALALEQDNPLAQVLDRLRGRLWSIAPEGRPQMGTAESVASISDAAVRAYYQRLFRPRRAVIVVAGNIPPDRARRLVEENLGAADWTENGRLPAPDNSPKPEVVPPGLRDVILARPAPASVFAQGRLAPGTQSDVDDWPAMLVLDTVLGGGKASRLFRLRDDGALSGAYEIRTLLVPSRIQSFWAVYVIGNGAPADTRAALDRALAALASGAEPVTDAELVRAKAYLKGQHMAARQRLKDRSYGVGWAEIMGLGAAFETDYDARIDAVTAEHVNDLAHRLLGANGAVVYTQ